MLVFDDKNNPLMVSNSYLSSEGGKTSVIGKFTISNIKTTYGFGSQIWIQELEILALEIDVG